MWVRQLRFCAVRAPCWRARAGAVERTFFNLPKLGGGPNWREAFGNRTKEYAEQRQIGYSMEQMYDIVVDVDKYTEFVPWCTKSATSYTQGNRSRCQLEIGFPPIVERYTSQLTFCRPTLVKSVCTEGRLFNELVTIWQFSPGAADNARSCNLDFSVVFEFRSLIHCHLSHLFFDEIVKSMVGAFLKRARSLHGEASLPAHAMKPRVIRYKA